MMRGRQIGVWIGKREAHGDDAQAAALAEEQPRKSVFWRFAPPVALFIVIIAVAMWVRHEGAYRRFIATLREGKLHSIQFQPFPGSEFVRVDDERGLAAVAAWLRDARPLDRRYGQMTATDCEMRIVMSDGSIKRLWLGQTGPYRSGGTLVPSNAYITLKGDGWERVTFSAGLCNVYMRLPVSAQLPFSSVPAMAGPGMPARISTTAPAIDAEVDPSIAQNFLERNEVGQARRLLARALALNANNGTAQQLMIDTDARIRIRLPLSIKELEKELAGNAPKLDREKYLQVREKLLDATLMAEPGDAKTAGLHQRLMSLRPEPNPQDFKEILRLGGVAAERFVIRDFAWSPDGATIATCGDDGRVRVWDSINGELLSSFPATIANKIYFSADGRKVWIWNDLSRTWWDVITGNAASEAKLAEEVRPPYRLIMADSDLVSFYFGKPGAQSIKQLPGHAGIVRVAKFSPDGDRLASFADDKVISIWGDGAPRGIAELSPYERLRRLKKLDRPRAFLFGEQAEDEINPQVATIDLPDGAMRVKQAGRDQRLLVEMKNGRLAVLQPDPKNLYIIKKPTGSCGLSDISPAGKTIAVGNLDGSVRIIDAETGAAVANLMCSPTRNRKWAACQFSADGGWVMACGVGFVSVWTTQTREQVFYSDKAAVEGATAAFTPDGSGLAIIYKDGGLRMLKSNLKEAEAVGWDQLAMRDPAFSKDGRWVAAIVKSGEVAIFDSSATALCHIAIKASTNNFEPLQFNPNGSVLLIKADDGSVRLVEVPSGRELRRLTMKDRADWLDMPCSFSPDGKSLIAGPAVWGVE